MEILLASQSPRRRELMRLVTETFGVASAQTLEEGAAGQTPAQTAQALAAEKAAALFKQRPDAAVIGCDTVVDLEGRVLGKPRDEKEAIEMLEALSGRRHQVHTGVCILALAPGGRAFNETRFVEGTTVTFSQIPKAAIEAVAKTDEPYDKAGGYGIQGWAAKYIPKIEGCYYNVMGLPVAALYDALARMGLL